MDTGIVKYRAFVAAAEEGSIAHAAEKLGYSVSSTSRMISDLETGCGLSLFSRSKAGVSLTSEGERLLVRARRIVAESDGFDEEVAAISGIEIGKVRIGTISSVATHVLPSVLRAFREKHWGVEYELLMGDYSEIESWVLDGRVDVGFVRLPTARNLATHVIARDEHMAVLPAGHPLANADAFPIKAFLDEPFMALERDGLSEVAPVLEAGGVFVRPTFTTWDDYAIMAMVEAGMGLGIIPSLMLQRCAYNIVSLPLDTPSRREIAAIWYPQRPMPYAATAFLDLLRERDVTSLTIGG